jgi:hypothetical protein
MEHKFILFKIGINQSMYRLAMKTIKGGLLGVFLYNQARNIKEEDSYGHGSRIGLWDDIALKYSWRIGLTPYSLRTKE